MPTAIRSNFAREVLIHIGVNRPGYVAAKVIPPALARIKQIKSAVHNATISGFDKALKRRDINQVAIIRHLRFLPGKSWTFRQFSLSSPCTRDVGRTQYAPAVVSRLPHLLRDKNQESGCG
jgi:hypothetical protein